eukprot:SAG31_NODE_6257_length_2100_cov_10.508246_2_plen_149_part_00
MAACDGGVPSVRRLVMVAASGVVPGVGDDGSLSAVGLVSGPSPAVQRALVRPRHRWSPVSSPWVPFVRAESGDGGRLPAVGLPGGPASVVLWLCCAGCVCGAVRPSSQRKLAPVQKPALSGERVGGERARRRQTGVGSCSAWVQVCQK